MQRAAEWRAIDAKCHQRGRQLGMRDEVSKMVRASAETVLGTSGRRPRAANEAFRDRTKTRARANAAAQRARRRTNSSFIRSVALHASEIMPTSWKNSA